MNYILKLNQDSTFNITNDPAAFRDGDINITKSHRSYDVVNQTWMDKLHGFYQPEPNVNMIYNAETKLVEPRFDNTTIMHIKIEILNHQLKSPRIRSNALGIEHSYKFTDISGLDNLTGIYIKCVDTTTNKVQYKSHTKTQITKLLSNARAYQKKLNTLYKKKVKELEKLSDNDLLTFNTYLVIE